VDLYCHPRNEDGIILGSRHDCLVVTVKFRSGEVCPEAQFRLISAECLSKDNSVTI
jgi:hypothetical protein